MSRITLRKLVHNTRLSILSLDGFLFSSNVLPLALMVAAIFVVVIIMYDICLCM